MRYRIEIAPEASAEIDAAYRWIARDSPSAAMNWFNELDEILDSLSTHPRRCPLAQESEHFNVEIRQMLHRPYRILFTIAGGTVQILHVRHAARRTLGEGDEDAASD